MAGKPQKGLARTSRQRIMSPSVTAPDLGELVDGCSAFAWDLYQVLRSSEGNLFTSPLSISLALAMAYAGARGETQAQMAQTLHLTLDQDRLHPAFNHLDLELAERGRSVGSGRQGFQLSMANAIWGQVGTEFLDLFLDTLATNYGAGIRLLDFAGAPERCRGIINAWASDYTGGRIRDLIPPGNIRRRTKLVLTNAVAFHAAWSTPFDAAATADGSFFLLDGSEVAVPMMNRTGSFAYAERKGVQAIELPYVGGELAMVVLLPPAGSFEKFERVVQAETVGAVVEGFSHRRVAFSMPRFQFSSSLCLAEALAVMGMPAAFSNDADFSGMNGERDLFLADVLHKAFVAVDEEGTEAAAATAAVMVPGVAPQEVPLDLRVDHPFLFFIRDIGTGAVLFVGRLVDPMFCE